MNKLLIRVKPVPGECFAGYTVRLAQENGFDSVQRFLTEFCNVSRHQLYLTPLSMIARLTEIKDQHEENLWLKHDLNGVYTYKGYVMPNDFVTVGKHFCAKCLATGGYRKAQWNLGWLPVCLTHKTMLTVGCKVCNGRFSRFKDARCHCVSSGLDHAVAVSDEVIDFIVNLEKELESSVDGKQWRAKLRRLLSEGYLKNTPYVYGRNYPVKTGLPDKLRFRLTPRRTLEIYQRVIESRKAA